MSTSGSSSGSGSGSGSGAKPKPSSKPLNKPRPVGPTPAARARSGVVRRDRSGTLQRRQGNSDDANTATPTSRPLSESLADFEGRRVLQANERGGAGGDAMPSRPTGWERPGQIRTSSSNDENDDDDATAYTDYSTSTSGTYAKMRRGGSWSSPSSGDPWENALRILTNVLNISWNVLRTSLIVAYKVTLRLLTLAAVLLERHAGIDVRRYIPNPYPARLDAQGSYDNDIGAGWNRRTAREAAVVWFPRLLILICVSVVFGSIRSVVYDDGDDADVVVPPSVVKGRKYQVGKGALASLEGGGDGDGRASLRGYDPTGGLLATGGVPTRDATSPVAAAAAAKKAAAVLKDGDGKGAMAAATEADGDDTSDETNDEKGGIKIPSGGEAIAAATATSTKKTPPPPPPPPPPALTNLADLTAPYNSQIETPYFWDVHLSGESVAERVLSQCHLLVQAAEHGLQQPDYVEDELGVFDLDGSKYVNVDLTTQDGIKRAKELKLAEGKLADVIVSPDLQNVAESLFDAQRKGRMFALFRHPVDRAVGLYYYLSTATWDPMYNPSLKDMSLKEYAKSGSVENNWLTRFLLGKLSGGLTKEDMVSAKNVVRDKVLVGLFDDLETSLARFDRYFGWSDGGAANGNNAQKKSPHEVKKCRKAFVEAGDKRHEHPAVESGSEEWDLIVRQNKFDMELYEFVKKLYKTQGKQIYGVV